MFGSIQNWENVFCMVRLDCVLAIRRCLEIDVNQIDPNNCISAVNLMKGGLNKEDLFMVQTD